MMESILITRSVIN